MKRKEEGSERMLNEIEASQLSDINFKAMVIRKLNELTGNYQKLQGNHNEITANYINMKRDIYSPNIGAPKYIKKILEDFKKDIDSNTIIVGDFNTSLSKMDRSSKQNTNKDIVALNDALD